MKSIVTIEKFKVSYTGHIHVKTQQNNTHLFSRTYFKTMGFSSFSNMKGKDFQLLRQWTEEIFILNPYMLLYCYIVKLFYFYL
jgi:hypothetical protein